MPITEISGLAGVVPEAPQPPAPFQGFAEQLLRAKNMQRQAALENIDAAMKMAEYDPDTAEKIGTPAIQEFAKHITGKGGGAGPQAPSIFRQRYEEAQKSRGEREQAFQADIAAKKEQTALAQTQRKGAEFTQEQEKFLADTERRMQANQYPDTPQGQDQRIEDARFVAMRRNLSPEMMQQLGLTPAQAREVQERNTLLAKTNLSQALLQVAGQAADLQMTPDQLKAVYDKQQVPDIRSLSTPALREHQLQVGQLLTGLYNARSTRMTSEAYQALTKSQANRLDAEAEKDLAMARAADRKGQLLTPDELIKFAESFHWMKQSGIEVPEEIKKLWMTSAQAILTGSETGLTAGQKAAGPGTAGYQAPFFDPSQWNLPGFMKEIFTEMTPSGDAEQLQKLLGQDPAAMQRMLGPLAAPIGAGLGGLQQFYGQLTAQPGAQRPRRQ